MKNLAYTLLGLSLLLSSSSWAREIRCVSTQWEDATSVITGTVSENGQIEKLRLTVNNEPYFEKNEIFSPVETSTSGKARYALKGIKDQDETFEADGLLTLPIAVEASSQIELKAQLVLSIRNLNTTSETEFDCSISN